MDAKVQEEYFKNYEREVGGRERGQNIKRILRREGKKKKWGISKYETLLIIIPTRPRKLRL